MHRSRHFCKVLVLFGSVVVPDPNPHQSDKLDPDPHTHQSDKLDPDPHQKAMLDPDPHQFADDKPKCMEYDIKLYLRFCLGNRSHTFFQIGNLLIRDVNTRKLTPPSPFSRRREGR
jgi:hypothetical protein